jgi:plasmid stabilization system protein ParE
VKRRFLLTPEAKADLRDILLDIAEDSPDAAERIRSEIYESFQRLGQSPGIGHYHEELGPPLSLLELLLLRCLLRLAAQPIQIFAVVHGARDLAIFLSSRLSSR